MKIKISDNAVALYRANEPEDVFHSVVVTGALRRLQGRTVEVDTSMLRKTSFVILPISGICNRETIKDYAVAEVIDDIRFQVDVLKSL